MIRKSGVTEGKLQYFLRGRKTRKPWWHGEYPGMEYVRSIMVPGMDVFARYVDDNGESYVIQTHSDH